MKRTPEKMYEDIRAWEMDAGESFLDYFDGNLNEANLLFWAMGKGYITEEDFRAWETEEYASGDDIIYGSYPFSIVKESEGDWHEEEYEKAMRILGEFLASTETYQVRVDEFLSNIHKIKLEDVARRLWKGDRVFIKNDGERFYVNSPHDVVQMSITKILNKQWYVDNNELDEKND